jgi:hypothetical protein
LPFAVRLERKCNINYLCTDRYEAYAKYSISKRHLTTTAEISLVESIILQDSTEEQQDIANLLA